MFSSTDICIAVTNTDNSTDINGTTIKYTAATVGGINDGVNYAVNAELSVVSSDYIPLPDYGIEKPKQPNPNSGVTLYRMHGDHRVYVIKNKRKRWIKTPKEFEDSDYKWSEVQEVAAELIEEYPDAEALVTELLRAIGDYKVYKLEGGKKSWIKTAREFNAAGHKWGDIREVSSETLASYRNAISSGLMRAIGSHKVYKLKDGKKCWIETAEKFNAAGHRWEDVEEVTAGILDDYPDSE